MGAHVDEGDAAGRDGSTIPQARLDAAVARLAEAEASLAAAEEAAAAREIEMEGVRGAWRGDQADAAQRRIP